MRPKEPNEDKTKIGTSIKPIHIWCYKQLLYNVESLSQNLWRPGFDSRLRRYDFRDWLSPASSRDMTDISLKRHKTTNQPTRKGRLSQLDVSFSSSFAIFNKFYLVR